MSEERATCAECNASFWRDSAEPWKTRCLPCWRRAKGPSRPAGESAAQLRRELHEALIEAAQLRYRLHQIEREPAIPSDMLRRLLSLSHPDRHGGSRIATEATQWLLAQREAGR